MSEQPPLYSEQPPPLRPRPMSAPRHMRGRWRYRGGMIAGGIILALAASTLYFRVPADDIKPASAGDAMQSSEPDMLTSPTSPIPSPIPMDDLPQLPEMTLPIEPEPYVPSEPPASSTPSASSASPAEDVMPAAPTTKKYRPKKSTGSYFVQLSAERGRDVAQRRFNILQRDHPDLLSDRSPVIKRANLGERGIFYRLYVGPFSNKGGAKNFCTALKRKGTDCLVRKP